MKSLFYGAAGATLAGLICGAGAKALCPPLRVHAAFSVPERTEQVDNASVWYADSGPHPNFAVRAVQTADASPMTALDRRIDALLARADYTRRARPEDQPALPPAPRDDPPAPYYASERGDILADNSYERVTYEPLPPEPPPWESARPRYWSAPPPPPPEPEFYDERDPVDFGPPPP